MSALEITSTSQPSIPTQFDVLVIGSGAAGLYAALCLPPHLQVGLITKDTLKTGASDWAQGGIAAAIAPNDSPQLHFQDTIKAGAGLGEVDAIEFLVEKAPAAIANLVNLGVAFDRRGKNLAMTLEAAHSRPRVLHAADTTGRAIVSTLTERVLQRENIQVITNAFALSLWIDEQSDRCLGVSLLYQSKVFWLRSPATILATGGGGQVFAQTTNPAVSTGDGVALAWRAGAVLRDLEFVQFHPTALTVPGAPHFLISEAVRGEGAHLVDESGSRFAFNYHPSGELAPRDVVSRAIFTHLQKTAPDPANARVYLDLRPIDQERIRHRFPNIIQVCQHWGIDVFQELIPVAPAAHYWMGGIATDKMNQTSIPGLYAIGETASTGVHGANRLASNSLLECIVYAAELSKLEVDLDFADKEFNLEKQVSSFSDELENSLAKLGELISPLQKLVWQSAGICRSQKIMEEAIAQIVSWRQQLATHPASQLLLAQKPTQTIQFQSAQTEKNLRYYAETFNLLDIAYLILKSAAFRTESRGGHYRSDYPETSTAWQLHTLVKQEHWWISPPTQSNN